MRAAASEIVQPSARYITRRRLRSLEKAIFGSTAPISAFLMATARIRARSASTSSGGGSVASYGIGAESSFMREIVAVRLRAWRRGGRLPLTEAAALLGMSVRSYRDYENGRRRPRRDILGQLDAWEAAGVVVGRPTRSVVIGAWPDFIRRGRRPSRPGYW